MTTLKEKDQVHAGDTAVVQAPDRASQFFVVASIAALVAVAAIAFAVTRGGEELAATSAAVQGGIEGWELPEMDIPDNPVTHAQPAPQAQAPTLAVNEGRAHWRTVLIRERLRLAYGWELPEMNIPDNPVTQTATSTVGVANWELPEMNIPDNTATQAAAATLGIANWELPEMDIPDRTRFLPEQTRLVYVTPASGPQ